MKPFNTICRSSHRRCSVRKGVLRNCAKFTGKHLLQSLFFNKVAGKIFLSKPSIPLHLFRIHFPVIFFEIVLVLLLKITVFVFLFFFVSQKKKENIFFCLERSRSSVLKIQKGFVCSTNTNTISNGS